MATIAALFLTMIGTWTALIVAVRAGVGTPGWLPPAQCFFLAGAVVLTWVRGDERVRNGTWASHAPVVITTVGVLFAPALAWIPGVGRLLVDALVAAAWLAAAPALIRGLRDAPALETVGALLAGAALGGTYFLLVNTKGYANVYSPEQALLGLQHRDTLYQASVAAMLSQFGIGSTGLDGVVPIRYHVLSNALVGVSGRWIGVTPIHAYYLVPQIVGIPLLFFSLAAATMSVWARRREVRGALMGALVPLACLLAAERWDWASYLVSESFAHGLTVLLFSVPLLLDLRERRGGVAPRVASVAAATVLLLFAKSSLGPIFLTGVIWSVVLAYGLRAWQPWVTVVTSAAALLVANRLTVPPSSTTDPIVGPLHFFRTYPDAAWPNLVVILAALALAAAAWLKTPRHDSRRDAIAVLVVLPLAGLGSGALLSLGAGGAYYFMNVGVWAGIVLASGAALLPLLAAARRPGLTTAMALATTVLLLVLDPAKRHGPDALAALAARVDEHGAAAAPAGRLTAAIATAAASAPRGAIVFVPPGNTTFWTLHPLCTAAPFLIPAVTALPLIQGLPPDPQTCPLPPDTGFGYSAYQERSRSRPFSDQQLCARANALGFDTVVVAAAPDDVRALRCR